MSGGLPPLTRAAQAWARAVGRLSLAIEALVTRRR